MQCIIIHRFISISMSVHLNKVSCISVSGLCDCKFALTVYVGWRLGAFVSGDPKILRDAVR